MTTSPTILGFDTSGPAVSCALMVSGAVSIARNEEMAKGQAERLLPLLEGVLAEAGVSWHALDAIAVGTGPGNFTGIRLSVAAARGLAERAAAGCPFLDEQSAPRDALTD